MTEQSTKDEKEQKVAVDVNDVTNDAKKSQESIQKFVIFVQTMSGKTLTLDVDDTDTVASIKFIIERKEGISFCSQRLVFRMPNGVNRMLENHIRLSDYDITPYSTLALIAALSGS